MCTPGRFDVNVATRLEKLCNAYYGNEKKSSLTYSDVNGRELQGVFCNFVKIIFSN